MSDAEVQARAVEIAEQLRDYCEWSGWYGTAPEPVSYPERLSSKQPFDKRLTVIKILTSAFQARERAVWKQAAEVATSHECGGEDDIICQHQNCAMLIEAKCRQHAQEVGP